MLLSLQDLTNPGYALIHAALLGSHLPTINGLELNSPQFTPAANKPWLPRLAELFAPVDGVHRLPQVPPAGWDQWFNIFGTSKTTPVGLVLGVNSSHLSRNRNASSVPVSCPPGKA